MKRLALILSLLPAAALAETSPVPFMQNMVGGLAGQLAITQAQLQDAQAQIHQLEQDLKKAKPEPKPSADQHD